jgi:hypothetical protein
MNQEQNEVKRLPAVQVPVKESDKCAEFAGVTPGLVDVKLVQSPQVPVMHPDKFAELIGLSSGVVGGWIDQGYVPTVKIGKYRLINIAAMAFDCRADIASIASSIQLGQVL